MSFAEHIKASYQFSSPSLALVARLTLESPNQNQSHKKVFKVTNFHCETAVPTVVDPQTKKKKTFIVLSKKERFKKRLKCPELIVQLVSVVFKSQIMANPKLGGEEGLGGRLSWLCKLRWRGCGRCLPANSRWQMTFRLSVAVWRSLVMIENYIYGINNQFIFFFFKLRNTNY